VSVSRQSSSALSMSCWRRPTPIKTSSCRRSPNSSVTKSSSRILVIISGLAAKKFLEGRTGKRVPKTTPGLEAEVLAGVAPVHGCVVPPWIGQQAIPGGRGDPAKAFGSQHPDKGTYGGSGQFFLFFPLYFLVEAVSGFRSIVQEIKI